MSGSTTQHTETTGRPQPTRNTGQKIAYAFGNLGQAAFYNTMSTFFITFVTTALFIDVDKTLAKRLIAVITGLVVVIRIAEIFLDPLLGNLVDNTNTRWGRFRPWQFIGGIVPGILGTIQAAEAIKYIAGVGQLLTDRLLRFNALTMRFSEIRLR